MTYQGLARDLESGVQDLQIIASVSLFDPFVKATPYSMPASGGRIPIEKCLETVKDLSKEAMSVDQLNGRLSVLSK